MEPTTNWEERFQTEIQRGISARTEGNEGMARVCARRAAGILVQAYFKAKDVRISGSSVLNHLKALRDSSGEPDDVRKLAGSFLLQITPDHVLPGDVDLIAELERLRVMLFPGS